MATKEESKKMYALCRISAGKPFEPGAEVTLATLGVKQLSPALKNSIGYKPGGPSIAALEEESRLADLRNKHRVMQEAEAAAKTEKK